MASVPHHLDQHAEGLDNTLGTVAATGICRRRLHLVGSVAHGDAYTSTANHLKVIEIVAYRHNLVHANVMKRCKPLHRGELCALRIANLYVAAP